MYLARTGKAVTLIDAAPQAGGRARAIELSLAGRRVRLDNGQHLLVGAYHETLALAREAGMAPPALLRLPMRLQAVDGLRLSAPALPAPWHLLVGLLRAKGLTGSERWALARQLGRLRAGGWTTPPATPTVTGWLEAGRQPTALIRRFWEPLCVATLNTAPHQACAATFARVLRDTLGAKRSASDFLLARDTLSDVLPDPALAFIARAGTANRIHLRATATALTRAEPGSGWHVQTTAGALAARAVILAIPPYAQARLLRTLLAPSPAALLARLDAFQYEPIATVYLAWLAADAPMLPSALMLTESPDDGAYGQWFFAREPSAGLSIGAVVVSARGRLQADPAALVAGIADQVSRQLGLATPVDARIVTEKRATFQCLPDRPRVTMDHVDGHALPWPDLWLAGDHAWPDYPATLEGAVRSGLAAAQAATASA